MNPFTFLFRLPLLPVRGFVRLGTLIQEQVEQEMASPARIRRQLEDVERARAAVAPTARQWSANPGCPAAAASVTIA